MHAKWCGVMHIYDLNKMMQERESNGMSFGIHFGYYYNLKKNKISTAYIKSDLGKGRQNTNFQTSQGINGKTGVLGGRGGGDPLVGPS